MRRTPTLGGSGARVAVTPYPLASLPATGEWGADGAARDEEMDGMDWRFLAECKGEDPELWFPIGTSGPAIAQAQAAIAICETCPVIEACLRWALESGQDSGIWGGKTEEERRALLRRYGKPARKRYFRKDA